MPYVSFRSYYGFEDGFDMETAREAVKQVSSQCYACGADIDAKDILCLGTSTIASDVQEIIFAIPFLIEILGLE